MTFFCVSVVAVLGLGWELRGIDLEGLGYGFFDSLIES